jgi:hypothetical protein
MITRHEPFKDVSRFILVYTPVDIFRKIPNWPRT